MPPPKAEAVSCLDKRAIHYSAFRSRYTVQIPMHSVVILKCKYGISKNIVCLNETDIYIRVGEAQRHQNTLSTCMHHIKKYQNILSTYMHYLQWLPIQVYRLWNEMLKTNFRSQEFSVTVDLVHSFEYNF